MQEDARGNGSRRALNQAPFKRSLDHWYDYEDNSSACARKDRYGRGAVELEVGCPLRNAAVCRHQVAALAVAISGVAAVVDGFLRHEHLRQIGPIHDARRHRQAGMGKAQRSEQRDRQPAFQAACHWSRTHAILHGSGRLHLT